ncbi:hypothetical protein B0H19DRAFT_1070563 [Mycena capillaripes]|nr:hypothetical protein B0H19DRAFT_1070563 [Mycena capillaripes]
MYNRRMVVLRPKTAALLFSDARCLSSLAETTMSEPPPSESGKIILVHPQEGDDTIEGSQALRTDPALLDFDIHELVLGSQYISPQRRVRVVRGRHARQATHAFYNVLLTRFMSNDFRDAGLDGLRLLTNLRTIRFRVYCTRTQQKLAPLVKYCITNAALDKIVLEVVAQRSFLSTVALDGSGDRGQGFEQNAEEALAIPMSGLTLKRSLAYVPFAEIYDSW